MKFFHDRTRFAGLHWRLLLAAGFVFSTPWAASQAVVLRETAEVSGGTMRLSDLLPTNAPRALRQSSDAIELGRSPEPGSIRVLDSAQITQALSTRPDLLRQLAIPDRVLIQRSGWTIQREAIRGVIRRFLLSRSDHRDLPEWALQSPDDIAAREENPALEVVDTLRSVHGRGLEFRLRCVQRALCSSFVVHLLEPQPSSSELIGSTASPLPALAKAPGPALVQAGKKAMLQIDDGKMRISLQVVCLERGRLSQKIRVLDASSHRVLEAEVVGAGQLHANL